MENNIMGNKFFYALSNVNKEKDDLSFYQRNGIYVFTEYY